jgi:tellurite resistance protein TehA-like permease
MGVEAAGRGDRGAVGARALDAIPPGAGAMVMATAVLSYDLAETGQPGASLATLAVAGMAWVLLGALLLSRGLRDPARVAREASRPAALTAVAATVVLGNRLALLGWRLPAVVMLVLGTLSWALLMGPVLRAWEAPAVGDSFLLTVSTESLAALLAVLASNLRVAALLDLALLALGLGLAFYAFVLRTFDFREVVAGRGDQWVAGGALAISALSAGDIAEAARSLGPAGVPGALRALTLALWVGAALWLPVLGTAELVSRRVLYDTRRWSTVFPVGMYAACSFALARLPGFDAFAEFARTWTWVALVVWAIVLAAMLWPLPLLLRSGGPGSPGFPSSAGTGG